MIELSDSHFGLYIHIPFCVKKCNYCDFASIISNEDLRGRYIHGLLNEIKSKSSTFNNIVFDSVYIGGGTPTVLDTDLLYLLCNSLPIFFDFADNVEFSIEINPGTINDKILDMLQKTDINRVSIGVQSFNNDELELLGRVHDKDVAIDTIKKISPLFNLNIDLMFGIPGQTIASWENTLNQAIALNPDHISAYSLIVEENTKFHSWIEDNKIKLPEESIEDDMYLTAVNILENSGYMQYEVSNFARINMECQHNIGYWRGNDSLGVGSSAVSYINKIRIKNSDNVLEYLSRIESNVSPVIYVERDSAKIGLLEEVMLGLRLCEGINLVKLENKWNCKLADASDYYKKLLNDGVLILDNENLKLSRKNFRFANNIIVKMMNEL
jgi:oxygen-independent coproporphyrinogen-3 oxidase